MEGFLFRKITLQSPEITEMIHFYIEINSLSVTFHFQYLLPNQQSIDLQIIQNSSQIYIYTISLQQIMDIRKGWCEVEDYRLLKIIKKYGTKNWTLISQKLSIGTTFERTGKQCRQRWHNHLNPDINNNLWTRDQDEILFDAHRKQGSKWKQISKLFTGRTDNSIKNHFYSTVRKSLRTISKLKGQQNITITMKSIKPYVLSKIVQNPQLTNLIVMLGRCKSKQSVNLNIGQHAINSISLELERIRFQYEYKNKQNSQLIKKQTENNYQIPDQDLVNESDCQEQQLPSLLKTKKLSFRPQEQKMKQYFEEFQQNQTQKLDYILQTNNQSKQMTIKQLFTTFNLHTPQTKQKCILAEKQLNEESCIFEEYQSNFFQSPSCSKKNNFPDLRLLAKVSRNSCGSNRSKIQDKNASTTSKCGLFKEEDIEIHFDPHEFLNEQFNDNQKEQ